MEGQRRPIWYAKYRLPSGRQVQRKIGPAWTARSQPLPGYYTRVTAYDWLRRTLDEARRGTLPGMVQTGATFADAAAEFLRYIENDRARKASTLADYHGVIRSYLLPAFGHIAVEDITERTIEDWLVKVVSVKSGSRSPTATATSSSPCSTASCAAPRRSTGYQSTRQRASRSTPSPTAET